MTLRTTLPAAGNWFIFLPGPIPRTSGNQLALRCPFENYEAIPFKGHSRELDARVFQERARWNRGASSPR